MDVETANLIGKYAGAASACFLPALIGAAVGRRFRSPIAGVAIGTLAGGGTIIGLRQLMLAAL